MAWFIAFGVLAICWWTKLAIADLKDRQFLPGAATGVLVIVLLLAAASASLANLVAASFNNVYVPDEPVHIVGKVIASSENGYTTLNAVGADRQVYETASFAFGRERNNTVVVYNARPENTWLSLWSNNVGYIKYNINPAKLEVR